MNEWTENRFHQKRKGWYYLRSSTDFVFESLLITQLQLQLECYRLYCSGYDHKFCLYYTPNVSSLATPSNKQIETDRFAVLSVNGGWLVVPVILLPTNYYI